MKLLDDCDLLKDQLTLNEHVARISDKTECVSYVDLKVDRVEMKRWMNTAERTLVGGAITFQNELRRTHFHG